MLNTLLYYLLTKLVIEINTPTGRDKEVFTKTHQPWSSSNL